MKAIAHACMATGIGLKAAMVLKWIIAALLTFALGCAPSSGPSSHRLSRSQSVAGAIVAVVDSVGDHLQPSLPNDFKDEKQEQVIRADVPDMPDTPTQSEPSGKEELDLDESAPPPEANIARDMEATEEIHASEDAPATSRLEGKPGAKEKPKAKGVPTGYWYSRLPMDQCPFCMKLDGDITRGKLPFIKLEKRSPPSWVTSSPTIHYQAANGEWRQFVGYGPGDREKFRARFEYWQTH